MRVSIVIPVYNEEPRLREVVMQVRKAVEKITKDYGLVTSLREFVGVLPTVLSCLVQNRLV